ncbi:DUF6622 family protein [Janthinobacterium sp. CAN_S1]
MPPSRFSIFPPSYFAPPDAVSRQAAPVSSHAARHRRRWRAQYSHRQPHTKADTMLQQIFSHTPLYVWAILGFLVYRGVLASRAREVSLRKLCIIPLVMLALSLSGVHGSFGLAGSAPFVWATGTLAGAALAWTLLDTHKIVAIPERSSVQRPGSWLPLILMMSIFCMKYAVAVTLAVAPSTAHASAFIVPVCLAYGVFSGLFLGGLLRTVSVYRAVQT